MAAGWRSIGQSHLLAERLTSNSKIGVGPSRAAFDTEDLGDVLACWFGSSNVGRLAGRN
jgi:hypothetical protein